MRKNSLKLFALIFSVVACATYGIVLACADGFWGYDYDSSFTPEASVDASYSPLFYAPSEIFYGGDFMTDNVNRFNDQIKAEWSDYLQGKIAGKNLSFLLLNDSASADIQSLYSAMKTKSKSPERYNQLNLNDKKVKDFIEFLYYANVIEEVSASSIDPWNYDATKKKTFVDSKTVSVVEKLYTTTSDPFLKNRYWFQTMKGYFYGAAPEQTIPFFEKTKADQPINTLYYRGLAYVAGVEYSKKNYMASNYHYSIVFDQCAALRQVTAYNFHPQENTDFNASLAMAKTNKEKAALWALFGYYADEKTAIQEIYKVDPANEHLDYLLTRLINKEEVKLNSSAFKSAVAYKRSAKAAVNPATITLVSQIANDGKTKQPYLWHAATAYLNTFAGNYTVASQYLEKAALKSPKTGLAEKQIRLLKLINTLYSIEKMDAKAESKLLPELTWLNNVCHNQDEQFRCEHAISWSKRYISSLYKSQQMAVQSELFSHDETYYRTTSNLEAMKSFLSKSEVSPWEKWMMSIYSISLSDIYEYQSVMNAYAGNLDIAIAFMEQAKDASGVNLLGNPFNGKIKDCHDCDHAAAQKVHYSKLSLLQKMKEMKANVEQGVDVYNNSLLLANAYYNMTYHGNARVFYYGDIMNQRSNEIDPYYYPQLMSCATAKSYYQKAFDAAANPEQRAKCVYMMTKCERNEYYNNTYYSGNQSFDANLTAWDGFKKLKEQYSNTKYYNEVIKECGYFRSYLGMK